MLVGRFHRRSRHSRDAGYMLLAILFMVFLLALALTVAAPRIAQANQRAREEEMIHRGAQYARAIKRFYKKFGRYPVSVDELKNTNKIRFLRKEYKDPMTKDGKWKLLHVGDVKLNSGSLGLGASNMGTGLNSSGLGLGQSSGLGGQSGGFGGQSSGLGGQSSGLGGQSSGLGGQSTGMVTGAGPSTGLSSLPGPGSAQGAGQTTGTGGLGGGQVFGGGAIIGVASLSEKQGLKVFDKKTKYNEWYFVFDPMTDRGALIQGPYTGKVFTGAGASGLNPAQGMPGGNTGTLPTTPMGSQPIAPLGGQQPQTPQQPQQQLQQQ